MKSFFRFIGAVLMLCGAVSLCLLAASLFNDELSENMDGIKTEVMNFIESISSSDVPDGAEGVAK